MPQKRIYVEEAIYFITTRTFNGSKIFSKKDNCELFLNVLDYCRLKYKFELFAFAVLLDHVHLLIRPNKDNISFIMRHIKGRFSRLARTEDKVLGSKGGTNKIFDSRQTGGEDFILADSRPRAGDEYILADFRHDTDKDFILADGFPLWQKSFYDRIIRNDQQLFNTLNYIDNNAVKHQLVNDPINYLYTSYHNHYKTGNQKINLDYLEL